MSNLSTLKVLFLFSVIVSPFTLKAQDAAPAQKDTSRLILIVMPGKTKPASNTSTTPATPTSPTYTAPSTSEKSGSGTITPISTAPIRTTKTGYAAPSTAERSGTVPYMVPDVPVKKPKAAITPGTAASFGSSSNTSTAVQPATVTSTQPATITPVPTITPAPEGSITLVGTKHIKVKGEKNDTTKKHHEEASSPRTNKILFGEVGGPGLAISLNYDARFGSEPNGLGFRIGAGYYGDGGNTVFTVPFQINYLIGHTNNFIELGGGTTFLNSTGDNTGKTFIFDRVTGLIGTATIGYRYQSDEHRLNFRIGFVPIFYDEGIIAAGGISIGYTFKANP